MMRLTGALALLLLAYPLAAQDNIALSVGGDVGVAVPVGDLADDGAETGFGLNLGASARLTPMLGIYGRYAYTSFGVEDDPEFEGDASLSDGGLGLGGMVWLPVEAGAFSPWAQAGLMYHRIESDVSGGGFSFGFHSERSLGFEGALGADIPVSGGMLLVQPIVRFRTYSFETEGFGMTEETSTSYLTIGVGVAYPIVIER